jgi:hypothetical protein
MRTRFGFTLALVLVAAFPAFAQRPNEGHPGEGPREQGQHGPEAHGPNTPRANQGHVPPPPPQREAHAKPEPEHRPNGKINSSQHVSYDHWYGHDQPNDKRFHLDHPFEHGRFEHFGPNYRYSVERFDRDHHRFWLPGGYYFEVAPWDWAVAADWCWDCGDDFVVYEDPDHPGWYMLYNVHTGHYVHVTYLGV